MTTGPQGGVPPYGGYGLSGPNGYPWASTQGPASGLCCRRRGKPRRPLYGAAVGLRLFAQACSTSVPGAEQLSTAAFVYKCYGTRIAD